MVPASSQLALSLVQCGHWTRLLILLPFNMVISPPPIKIPYRNALSPAREANQSPPSNAGIKSEWNYNCTPPHAFMSRTNVNKQQILAYIACVGFC